MKDRIINYNLLWEKLRDYAVKIGRLGTRPLLLLYLVLKSPQTSKEDKLLIISTLSYLVLPIDILDAKKLPIIVGGTGLYIDALVNDYHLNADKSNHKLDRN